MGIELPGALTTPLSLIGMEWPKGDETAMDRLNVHWSGFASDVNDLADDLSTLGTDILSTIEGDTHDALETHIKQFFNGDKSLQELIKDAEYLADCCSTTSNEILALKILYIVELVALAAILVALAASAWINWGAPAEMAAAQLVTRAAIEVAVKKTIQTIARKLAEKALKEIAKDLGQAALRKLGAKGLTDLALQLSTRAGIGAGIGSGTELGKQILDNVLSGKDPTDIDWGKVADAAKTGAVSSVALAPVAMPLKTSIGRKIGAEFDGNKMNTFTRKGAEATARASLRMSIPGHVYSAGSKMIGQIYDTPSESSTPAPTITGLQQWTDMDNDGTTAEPIPFIRPEGAPVAYPSGYPSATESAHPTPSAPTTGTDSTNPAPTTTEQVPAHG